MVGIGKRVEQGRNWKGGFCRIQGKMECGKWRKMSKRRKVCGMMEKGGEVCLQYVVYTRKNGIYKAKKGRKNGHMEKVLRKSRTTNNKYQLRININIVSRETLPVSKIERYNTLL